MENQSISDIFENWEMNGVITDKMAELVEERFKEIIRYEIGYINDLIDKKKPHRAFGRLSRMLSFFNMVIVKKPSILNLFEAYIADLRQRVDLIAKGMKAKEYNITLNIPAGISITMVIKS